MYKKNILKYEVTDMKKYIYPKMIYQLFEMHHNNTIVSNNINLYKKTAKMNNMARWLARKPELH